MKKKKILVLTDHMPWGHRSIAKAIYGYLKDKESEGKYEVEYTEVRMSFSVLTDMYVFMYRYLPMSNKITNKVMENETLRDLFLEMTDKNLPPLKRVVDKYKPDLIISSYFLHSQSLARWKSQYNKDFELWTVVADPWTVNPISFVLGADLHLVYDEIGKKLAIKYGVLKDKILKTGWWVRKITCGDKSEIKRKLNIDENNPVIFFGGGSLGTSSITKFLPILMLINKPCTIIFNTGTDKFAYRMVNQYKKMFDRLRGNEFVKIINLGWIDNMAEVLSISDIVFGKAGPNFLFDVVNALKPFVAITHIGGQEDGNIELIKKKKLGWIKEGLGEAEDFLLLYLKNPEKYNHMFDKEIGKEAELNKKSLPMVGQKVDEWIKSV